jgi:hypothetical protein
MLSAAALSGGNAGFLRASSAHRTPRLSSEWMPPPAPPPAAPPPLPPPSWAVDLMADGALETVLAAPSRRDSSVGRVAHTRGGPRAALARWSAYVSAGGLRSYDRHRNDPLAPDTRAHAGENAGVIDLTPHPSLVTAHRHPPSHPDRRSFTHVGVRERGHDRPVADGA